MVTLEKLSHDSLLVVWGNEDLQLPFFLGLKLGGTN